jgi:hypothetical protein
LIYIAITMLEEIKGYLKGMRGIYPKQFTPPAPVPFNSSQKTSGVYPACPMESIFVYPIGG